LFGEALYEAYGIRGVGFCDEDSGFACYHGFFSHAISNEGIKILSEAESFCTEKFGFVGGIGCQHGIGHGVMEYFGSERLDEALAACSTLTWQRKLFGCQDGVFMQYNFPTALDPKGNQTIGIRKLDPNDPLYPCDEVPDKHRFSCYYNLPQWLSSQNENDFSESGRICSGIQENEFKTACFLGTGDAISGRLGFDVQSTINSCKKMSDLHSQALCRAGAAWAFLEEPNYKHLYTKLCENMESSAASTCKENLTILQDITRL
jgi:hypothetical protein